MKNVTSDMGLLLSFFEKQLPNDITLQMLQLDGKPIQILGKKKTADDLIQKIADREKNVFFFCLSFSKYKDLIQLVTFMEQALQSPVDTLLNKKTCKTAMYNCNVHASLMKN